MLRRLPSVDPDRPVREFGQVFDGVAKAYDELRPGYPAELVDAAMERGGLSAGSRVLEVGTGKLTELLAERGLVVDAVDPGPNMIEAARKRVGPTDAVRFHLGRFEDLELPENAYAALFSATAFHWLDPTVSWSKAASHLAPGGLLALLMHIGIRDEQSDESEQAFRAILRKHAPELEAGIPGLRDLPTILAAVDERRGNPSEVWDWLMGGRFDLANADAAKLFDDVEVQMAIEKLEQPADEVIARFRTTSLYFQIDPSRRQAFEDDDRRQLEERGGIFHYTQAAVLMTARRT
jgi:SAM-dependent methyltransferase